MPKRKEKKPADATWSVGDRECVPVDATARRVVQRGYSYVPDGEFALPIWSAPPPCVEPPSNTEDLRGMQQGRLTVVGYLNSGNNGAGGNRGNSQWLVRCACGRYEMRRGKKWRRGYTGNVCCQWCKHTIELRRRTANV